MIPSLLRVAPTVELVVAPEFPIGRGRTGPPTPAGDIQSDPAGWAVLWIDDELSVIKPFVSLLTMEGCHVESVATGAEGLARARHRSYDVIVLDFKLPDLSGMQVLEQLRRGGIRTPVIMLTAYATFELAVEAARLGVTAFKAKPIFFEDLFAAIRDVVSRPVSELRPRPLQPRVTCVQPSQGPSGKCQVKIWIDAEDCEALKEWARDAGESAANLTRRVLKTYLHARQLREREKGSSPTSVGPCAMPAALRRRVTLWIDVQDRTLLVRYGLDDGDSHGGLIRRVLHSYVRQRRLHDSVRER
jgi:CheY-like chemotaxis protein